MPPRSTLRRLIAIVLALGVVGTATYYLRRPVAVLPPAASYPALPGSFARALSSAREKVRAHPRDAEAWRVLARLYQANRLYAEATQCHDFVAALPGGLTGRDHYYRAEIAQHAGNLGLAIAELRAVERLAPDYLPARVQLADALFKSGEEEPAADAYGAILRLEAQQVQASVGLARVELLRSQDSAAIARLEALMGTHPESTSGAALLAQLFARRGETARAEAMTQWSQQRREPVLPDPWLDDLLGDCYDTQRLTLKFEEYLFTGQMEAAAPYLDRVVELDPAAWTPHLLRGWSEARSSHHATAIAEFRRALEKGGDPEKICPLLATSLIGLPDVPGAGRMLAESLTKLPESIPLLTAYSEVALKLGDETLATGLLQRILAKEPYLYNPNLSLAKILWSRGQRDDAVICLQRIAQGFPVDVASRGLLGQYYLEKAEPARAIAPLEQARLQAAAGTPAEKRLTEMLGLAYLQAGAADAASGRIEAASRRFIQAVALAPPDPKTHAFAANTWVELRAYDRAAEALAAMAKLDPKNPTIELSWGDVVLQQGALERARAHWMRALELAAPHDTELRAALAARLRGDVTADTLR